MKILPTLILIFSLFSIIGCNQSVTKPTPDPEPMVIDNGKIEYKSETQIPKQITDFIYFLGEYNLQETRTEDEINGQLNKAFELVNSPNKEQYQKIQYVRTRTLIPRDNNEYYAELEFFNIDKSGEIHEIIFKQDANSNINIISDEQIPLPYVIHKLSLNSSSNSKPSTAMVTINNKNQRQIYLNDKLIETINPNQGYTIEIKDFKISSNSEYFEYKKIGWEQEETAYVNINTAKTTTALP